MAEAISVSRAVTGTNKSLAFETGKLAPQSQGAVVATIGDTTVLATANASKGVREGIDFFPLTVDVEERMYAAGKIPGSFFRREGRPSDLAILNARLIDRPLRPSFPDGYRNETQVVITVLGADQENPQDVLGINAASAALMLSGIPFEGPIGAVRIAYSRDGEWIAHPTYDEGDDSTFELVVAGRQVDNGDNGDPARGSDDIAIMMVEAGGTEKATDYYDEGAPKVTEEVIAAGLEASKQWIRDSIEMQRQLVDKAGTRAPLEYTPVFDYTPDVIDKVAEIGSDRLAQAQTIADKTERSVATDEVMKAIVDELAAEGAVFEDRTGEVKAAIRSVTKKVVRKRIVEQGLRIDGRTTTDIRPLSAEVQVLPTAHGSGLFQRGETQVLDVCTLGMPRMDQLLDTLAPENRKRYMHHYNMPPHANGEVGRVGSPKRREIGHGLLAERALLPVVPSKEHFPYTLRLVSEVLSSNGSTSMASVCASSLALMDAGVPVRAHVGGIAMGLVYEDGKYITLTDILGAEDAFGDMDFKVAGTSDFVTALQLDTKIDGLPADVLAQALQQARDARLQVLEVMSKAITEPRAEVGETAPKIISFEIPMDKIGEVIGPKGKVINAIQLETGADIAVDDDGSIGTVTIGSVDGGAVEEAKRQIQLILNPPTAGVGEVYTGRVVNITKFGAFVNILPGRDGLLHISKMGGGRRIDRVEDVLELGDEIEVRVDDVDPNGKVSLSPITPLGDGAGGHSGGTEGAGGDRAAGGSGSNAGNGGEQHRSSRAGREEVSFEDSFDAELRQEFGDLGPAEVSGDRGDRGGRGDRRAEAGVVAAAVVAIGAVDDLSETEVRRTVLANGIPVLTERMPEARSVTTGFWVAVGGRDEQPRFAGASHFLEHLVFKGTATRSARDIAESVEAVGGEMNAFTSREHTAYYTRLPADELGFGLDLLCDVLSEPALRAPDVDAEREVILEELALSEDTPDDKVHSLLADAVFPHHPLGREVLGDVQTVESLQRDDIGGFFGEHYRPANVVIAAAGRLEHDDVVDGVKAFLEGMDSGARVPRNAPATPPKPLVVHHRATEQAHMAFGWRAIDQADDDRYALALGNQVFGGGMSSRLFQEIREERGLAYSVYSGSSLYADSGLLMAYVGTAPNRAREVKELLDEQVNRLVDDGITDQELTVASGFVVGSLLLSLEDSGSRMGRLGRAELSTVDRLSVDEQVERVRAVTVDDVHDVLRRVLAGPRSLAVVGPFDESVFA